MKLINSPAVIYKLYRYSDKSAIAMAFTPEYGKVKLFMQNAYSKKGGVMTFVPGTVTFKMKDSSDMHRLESFSHDPAFHHYICTPDITFRLHLVFDIFHNLYEVNQPVEVFWRLIQKFDQHNFKELTLYSAYRLLKESGSMFEVRCSTCGGLDGSVYLKSGQIVCENCNNDGLFIDADTFAILKALTNNEEYRSTKLSPEQEISALKVFSRHIDDILGKENCLKSLDVFYEL